MALSKQQFLELKRKGLSVKQIVEFEKKQPKRKQGFLEKTARFLAPKSVEKFGETIGSALATFSKDVKSTEAIPQEQADAERNLMLAIQKNKKEGKDTSKLVNALKNLKGNEFKMEDVFKLEGGKSEGSILEKSGKEIAGEALGTLGAVGIGIKAPASIAGRLALGTGLGSTFGTAQGLQEDETAANVVTSGLIGGLTGLAVGGIFEGIGYLGGKVIPKIGKHTYTKELQPPNKDLTNQVEMGWRTFGEKVRGITDDAGKPVYQGTYTTIREQAENQLKKTGNRLLNLAKKYDNTVNINRSQAAGDVIERLQNTFGKLSKNQLDAIKFEVNRMPAKMNVTKMIENKRMYDSLIPDSYWLKAGDANVAFATQVKYILRDNLRKIINGSTDDALMRKFNNELSIAMDVKHLASEQIAKRIKQKISGEGGFFYKLIGRFIDDVVFNPAITTRASQATLRAGEKTGQTPLRSATRGLIIKDLTE